MSADYMADWIRPRTPLGRDRQARAAGGTACAAPRDHTAYQCLSSVSLLFEGAWHAIGTIARGRAQRVAQHLAQDRV